MRSIPVSYTHLSNCGLFPCAPDRYHTEDLIHGYVDKTEFLCAEVHAEERRTPVSYTHLDVYKRQVLDVALQTGYIEDTDIATLNEWRKDPAHRDAGK